MTSLKTTLAPYLQDFQNDLLLQVTSSVPLLTEIVQYYISKPSKRLRPCLILLMCQATNGLGSEWHDRSRGNLLTSDRTNVLSVVLPTQVSLAQIIEIVHVASLLHDDVLDNAETRRGAPSAPMMFGANHSILGGDYLLGRVLGLAANLNSIEALAYVSRIICSLVEGEVIQANGGMVVANHIELPQVGVLGALPDDALLTSLWNDYLTKTYMKTASLFSQALQCAVILGGAVEQDYLRDVAAIYGGCLGMAYQLIDDLLDFEGDASSLGKPAHADLRSGLVTAPVFFALQEDDSVRPMVLRRFTQPGDVEKVSECVCKTQALIRTRAFAESYARRARESLSVLPPSAARRALEDLTAAILARQS